MSEVKQPLLIAHRGESHDAPENTMAAINLAWERGAEAVEIDIQLSKDEEVAVIHDLNTKRLANVYKNVKDQSLTELQQLDVGSWKDVQFKGEEIPAIEEVLQSVPAERKLIIEIKSGPEIVPILKAKLERTNLKSDQIEIIGFALQTMIEARKQFSDHKVLWLLDLDYTWQTKLFGTSIDKGIVMANKYGFDGLNVWAGKMLDRNMIEKVHASGLLLYCWTVNDIEKAKVLREWGIDGITTDRAEWMSNKMDP